MPATVSISRRQLLRGRPLAPPFRPRPPGVTAESVEACTGCAACVEACPEQVLGLDEGRVVLLSDRGECSLCGLCAPVCPEPVFAEVRVMAHVALIGGGCLASAGITCMSCRDACGEGAIRMLPRIGGPFLPTLDASLCTGCGGCVAPCPGEAIDLVPRTPVTEGAMA